MAESRNALTAFDPRPEPHQELGHGDGYVVLVSDPVTGEVDTYGPHLGPGAGLAATCDADRRRRELDVEQLDNVVVGVVRLHPA